MAVEQERLMRYSIDMWFRRHLGGHVSFKMFGCRVVVYGHNAMHFAINIRTRRWGYVCFHPYVPILWSGWGWYFYLSPNATPSVSTFAIGPGIDKQTKQKAKIRREMFGHNFDDRVCYDGPHQDLLG